MAFTRSLWTREERQSKRKKTVIIAFIVFVIFIIIAMVIYFKKTSTDKISTTDGVKTIKELEDRDITSIENAIEDRRGARDKKNAKLDIEDDDESDDESNDESDDESADDDSYESDAELSDE